jgi:FkbM family methyltransferase
VFGHPPLPLGYGARMHPLALSWMGRLAGRIPVRGVPRLLFTSYARASSLPAPTTTTSRHGDRFHVDFSSFLEWQLWAFGAYEPNVAELLSRLVRPGDIAVDVGANVGIHTVRLAKLVGATGHVFAVEPASDLADRLRTNLALNAATNVTVVQAAAGSGAEDFATLHRPPGDARNQARSSVVEKASLSGARQQVPVVRIDDLAASSANVKLIKIDVEGAELDVLEGAASTIATHRPSLVCEIAVENALAVTEFLHQFGYSLLEISVRRGTFLHRRGVMLREPGHRSRRSFDALAQPVST